MGVDAIFLQMVAVVGSIFVIGILFFIFRNFMCWYWMQTEQTELLREIVGLMRSDVPEEKKAVVTEEVDLEPGELPDKIFGISTK